MICGRFLCAQPRFARLDYYTTSLTVCQGVFEKFFEFFSRTFLNRFSAGEEVPEHYTTLSCICQEVFQKFFQLFSCFFSQGRSRGYPLVDSLHIIALSVSFVNRFLQSFLSLELRAGLHKQRASRLCNLPNKCQFLSQTGECSGSVTLIFHAFSPSMRQSAF